MIIKRIIVNCFIILFIRTLNNETLTEENQLQSDQLCQLKIIVLNMIFYYEYLNDSKQETLDRKITNENKRETSKAQTTTKKIFLLNNNIITMRNLK